MPDIRTQQFLYHLTDLNNLEDIFSGGLKSRSLLRGFSDVADPEIIASRCALRLEEYVPFHFLPEPPLMAGSTVIIQIRRSSLLPFVEVMHRRIAGQSFPDIHYLVRQLLCLIMKRVWLPLTGKQ